MGEREFARACIRIKLNSKLPCGIWVEGLNGTFFQKFEYENLSSLCFKCGRIGHKDSVCPNVSENPNLVDKEPPKCSIQGVDNSYGPWMHVKFKNKKRQKILLDKKQSDLQSKDNHVKRDSRRNPIVDITSDLVIFNKHSVLSEQDNMDAVEVVNKVDFDKKLIEDADF
ncbi:hypothetical protein MA16_Dca008898 [Dendrobium catenatum]|uniref:CCHC-type domain-containing protein n=1 Tax=Dendrobium catenatum TaxID=906689 RepID=A0A2I0VUN6_9ASPA|nr:hypothetical protein MA16_Dca008898 [Dendrobium catenatum]